MFKSQEAELRIKNLSQSNIPGVNISEVKNVSLNSNNEKTEQMQSK